MGYGMEKNQLSPYDSLANLTAYAKQENILDEHIESCIGHLAAYLLHPEEIYFDVVNHPDMTLPELIITVIDWIAQMKAGTDITTVLYTKPDIQDSPVVTYESSISGCKFCNLE